MPTIEVTQAQADDFARGKSITIDPPREYRYVLVFGTGNVFLVTTEQPLMEHGPREVSVTGKCVLIAKGPHSCDIGYVQTHVAGHAHVVPYSTYRPYS